MKEDIRLFNAIKEELDREKNTLEMIASENFYKSHVLDVVEVFLTNKYAEGYPGKRYYGGCEAVDKVENIAKQRCEELFKLIAQMFNLILDLKQIWLFF